MSCDDDDDDDDDINHEQPVRKSPVVLVVRNLKKYFDSYGKYCNTLLTLNLSLESC